MKSSITRRHGTAAVGVTLGFTLAILCAFAPWAAGAEPDHHDNHNAHQNVRHDVRHDTYRRDDSRHHDGYRDGYAYGPPPVVYAPQASPGISLFLPLQFR